MSGAARAATAPTYAKASRQAQPSPHARQRASEPSTGRFEREADALAAVAVDGGSTPLPGYSLTGIPVIQRKCKCGNDAASGGTCEECAGKAQVQTKLRIAESGDPLEQQADRIAERVTSDSVHSPAQVSGHDTGLGELNIARRALPEPARDNSHSDGVVETALAQSGASFESAARRDMERRFGHDFSQVRVHTSPTAAQAADALQARAFTYGRDVYFGEGQYSPGTADGRRLIAHELAHVLQQSPAIHRQEKTPASNQDKYCHHDELRGVNRKIDTWVYLIMLTAAAGDTYEALKERELPKWIDWRYGKIPAEDKAKILAAIRGAPRTADGANVAITAGCQYSIGLDFPTYAALNRIGDKNRPAAKQGGGEGGKGGGSKEGKGPGGGSVIAGKKGKPSTAPIPEEDPTIGIGEAAKELEKIKHDKTATVHVDLTIFEKDPKLSKHLLDSLEHFAGRAISAQDTAAAADGLSADELNAIIGGNASYRMLTNVYTQGWNEFKAAGGKDADPFFMLEEALLEQLARGNPTAATNKLEIGHGNLTGEDKIIGIRDRDRGWLLYDETGTPFPGFSGMGFRDHGYVGSRVKPDGGLLDSFQLNIANIEDPGLYALLNTVRMNLSDPTRVTLQAANFIFHNVEILKDGIIQEVPAKLRDALKDTLKYFIGFMVGEAASSFMMKSANPTLMGVGLALKLLLKGAEYAMDVEMYGSIVDTLYEAGRHLVKIEKRPDGTFTNLSARHLRNAKAPLVSLLTQIGLLGGMKLSGKLIGIILKLRAGGKAEIHCSHCTITDTTDAPAKGKAEVTGEPKVEGKDEPGKAAEKDEPTKEKGKDEPGKQEPQKADDPNAPKEGKQTKPPAEGGKDAGEQGKAETSEAKRDAAKRSMDAAQARFGRFKSLIEALAAARKRLQDAKNCQAVQRGGSLESNAAVRDAQAQIADILSALKKEFDVDPNDSRALDAKRQELIGDFKQAKDAFTPLDVQLDPGKYRAKLPCFAAGTPVATPQGLRSIEALTAGDQVIAFDFQTGRFELAAVLDVQEAITDRLVHISVTDQEIVATGRHPFWVEDVEGWVEAHALRAGMRLKTVDGSGGRIAQVRVSHAADTPTFNLQVERLSSFCVGPGVLVHNEGVDAGQGGSYLIYRLTNPDFPGRSYIGQTTTSGKAGKSRGAQVRKGEHVKEADVEIEAIKAELAGKPPSPEVQAKLDFFEFKKGASVEVLVYGIGNQSQADWLEQQNIDIERQLKGDSNVVNRRNQISKERIQEAKEEILKDPKVKCE